MEDRSEREPLCPRNDSSDNNRLRRYFPVLEPAVFVLLFALEMSETVYKNQVVYQVCTAVYQFSHEQCALLGTANATDETKAIEALVQPYTANIFMIQILLENIVPALGVLLIGPWSDKFGRRPVILATFLGFAMKYISFALICFLSKTYIINPWFYVIGIIPELVLGGNSSFSIGCISYIRDISTQQERAFRIMAYEGCVYAGLVIGSFSSSYVLQATNSEIVLAITGSLVFCLLIYLVIFLKERVEINSEVQSQSKLRQLFRFSHVGDTIKICFKRRPNCDRAIILLTMTTLGLHDFVLRGSGTIFYLFIREKFEWTVRQYTTYEAVAIGVQVASTTLAMIVLRKMMRVRASSLILLAYASTVLDVVVKAAASKSWHLYLAIGVGMIKGMVSPMSFALLTIVVLPNETGKIFSLVNALQAFLPISSAPLYTLVYKKTLKFYPGTVHFISAGVYYICFILMACVSTIERVSVSESLQG